MVKKFKFYIFISKYKNNITTVPSFLVMHRSLKSSEVHKDFINRLFKTGL
ncbi:hypothetical protein SAMN05444484_102683 [Flavobacterium chilense]|uniref:Uncharacterized protein n=1 Tax=Flavobacterium chilense TaxID=946677 RepID=A0A1M7DQT2_9FLAO|nr:hypothetical protein SAMN05444484_102683 [Flavobacterium chilense]